MQIVNLILSIVSMTLNLSLFVKLNTLKTFCTKIKNRLTKLGENFETNNMVLNSRNAQLRDFKSDVEKIVFGNGESIEKVSKLIELLQKCNSPKKN